MLKYDTVTGSGVQTVERRGLIESYQVGNDVYMMLTTSNAVKFEQKGSKERETEHAYLDVLEVRLGQGAQHVRALAEYRPHDLRVVEHLVPMTAGYLFPIWVHVST